MIVAAHLAPLSTVIPTQVGTHASVGAHYEGDELLRSAASAVFFADRAPVATCVDPGLRRDDEVVGEIETTWEVKR